MENNQSDNSGSNMLLCAVGALIIILVALIYSNPVATIKPSVEVTQPQTPKQKQVEEEDTPADKLWRQHEKNKYYREQERKAQEQLEWLSNR